jgi:putative tricarboxylic transport membrane protein
LEEKMNKRERDRMSALFWLVVAVGICSGSIRYSLGSFQKPGPGFFPFLGGAVLGILSFFVFLQTFKGLPGDERKALWSNPKGTLKVVYIFIALILYTIGMNYIGFFFSTLLFLGFLLRGIEPQRWSVVLAWSIISTIASYGIFKYTLDLQLPGGILGF